jgi:hypothetical protein
MEVITYHSEQIPIVSASHRLLSEEAREPTGRLMDAAWLDRFAARAVTGGPFGRSPGHFPPGSVVWYLMVCRPSNSRGIATWFITGE